MPDIEMSLWFKREVVVVVVVVSAAEQVLMLRRKIYHAEVSALS